MGRRSASRGRGRHGPGQGPQRLLHEHGRHEPREGGEQRPPGVLEPGRRDHRLPQRRVRTLPRSTTTRRKASTSTTSKTGQTKPHANEAKLSISQPLLVARPASGSSRPSTAHGLRPRGLAFPAEGTGSLRPDPLRRHRLPTRLSADGKKITWGKTDWDLFIAIRCHLGNAQGDQRQADRQVRQGDETYHTDFSPDGKYVAFSYGPEANEMGAGLAPGWNICVSDLNGKWVQSRRTATTTKSPIGCRRRINDLRLESRLEFRLQAGSRVLRAAGSLSHNPEISKAGRTV